MSKSNNKIKLSEEEALKIIVDLDQIVVSLDKIKSHFTEDSDFQKHDKILSDYIINEKVNQTLAQIRGLLSSKFSLSVGEDDNECAVYTETNGKLKEIIHNILNNAYPEVLSYDPKMDEKVDYKKKKIVWEIPEIFRETI